MSPRRHEESSAGRDPDPGWGLILTGGGNRRAIQAGALRALFETGIPACSHRRGLGWAINGAYLAFHPSEAGVTDLVNIWRNLDGRELFGTRHAQARTWLALISGRPAAFTNRGLRRLLASELPGRRFADTTVPLAVTATHLETGTGRVITQGNVVDAVLASSALPGFLPPVTVEGELLVDGAVADPMPTVSPGRVGHGCTNPSRQRTGEACLLPGPPSNGLEPVEVDLKLFQLVYLGLDRGHLVRHLLSYRRTWWAALGP